MTVLELLAPYGWIVVGPLGLRVCGERGKTPALLLGAGIVSASAFTLEQDWPAALLAAPCVVVAAWIAARMWRAADWLLRAALAQLVLAGAWLVASRAGLRMPHFPDAVVIMTALHFLYAGFGVCVFARATAARLPGSLARAVSWIVALCPLLMVAGTALTRWLEVAAGMALAAGVTVLAGMAMVSAKNRIAQLCFSLAAASAVIGMAIASMYAWTEMGGAFWLPIPQMAVAHGVANAIGFCTVGLAGHLLESGR